VTPPRIVVVKDALDCQEDQGLALWNMDMEYIIYKIYEIYIYPYGIYMYI